MTTYLLSGRMTMKFRRRGVPVYWMLLDQGIMWLFVHDNQVWVCENQREVYKAIDYFTGYSSEPVGVVKLGVFLYDKGVHKMEEEEA